MKRVTIAIVFAGLAAWVGGCSGSNSGGGGGAQSCGAVGQAVACSCLGGSVSSQTCLASGALSPCACGAGQAGITGGAAGTNVATGASGAAGSSQAGVSGGLAGNSGAGGAAGEQAQAGAGGTGGGDGTSCFGSWAVADPSVKGPYTPMVESNVGPGSAFTMYRPSDLAMGCSTHPLITWGNGTGTTPPTYAFLLNQLASHGFIVIASNSMNVAMGTPAPMIQGVDWVLQQNDDSSSALYKHVDTAHIGATGHSQGAIATSSANTDARMSTMAPIEGGRSVAGQHGPALLICGGMDTTLPCSGHMASFTAINDRPVMLADMLAADHTNWIVSSSYPGSALHPYTIYITAWMRYQVMGDAALKSWFYGADCKICKDSAWQVMQKMM